MPFYEYECQDCKFYSEVMQKITDPPLRKCPSCGKNALKKLVSAPVFRLKGSGWYETDFKSDEERKRNLAVTEKEDAKPEVKAESSEAKSEAKPTPPPAEAAKESRPAAPPRVASGGSGAAKPAARAGTKAATRPKARAKARPARKPARKGRR